MKYLFVIQGEGRGHFTQALSLKSLLERNGHEVVSVMVGCSAKRTLPDFFTRKIKTDLQRFQSPNFLPTPKGKKSPLLFSIIYNILLIPVYIESIFKIHNTIRTKNPDVVINFYELLCGITYGILNPRVPMVNVAHQYYFLTEPFQYTGKNKWQFKLLNLYSRFTALNAQKILALSFRDEKKPFYGKITIVPPLLRQEVLNLKPSVGNYIHGYLLNSGYADELSDWSKKNPNDCLQFFWDKKNVTKITELTPSLTMHTLDDIKFIEYMAGSKAYATTAGFESVCEAMYMQKPVLMVPTHIEQECNAIDAINSKAGVSDIFFNLSRLLGFIPSHKKSGEFKYWVQSAESMFVYELTNFETESSNIFATM